MSLKKSIELLNVMARILVVQKIRSNFKYVWKCRLCKHVQGCWVQVVAVSFNPSMPPFSNCDRNSKSSHKQQCQDRTTGCWLYVNPFPLVRDPKIILIQKKKEKEKKNWGNKKRRNSFIEKIYKDTHSKKAGLLFQHEFFLYFFSYTHAVISNDTYTHIYYAIVMFFIMIMSTSCVLYHL